MSPTYVGREDILCSCITAICHKNLHIASILVYSMKNFDSCMPPYTSTGSERDMSTSFAVFLLSRDWRRFWCGAGAIWGGCEGGHFARQTGSDFRGPYHNARCCERAGELSLQFVFVKRKSWNQHTFTVPKNPGCICFHWHKDITQRFSATISYLYWYLAS